MHGGHVGEGDDLAAGFDNWRKTFAYAAESTAASPLPILIENTAGGDNACARRFDALARLWDAVGEFGAGFCLDTCHAHAGGEELLGIVDRVKAITGRIDLIHANDSKDAFDSGADRHDNLGSGQDRPRADRGGDPGRRRPGGGRDAGRRRGPGRRHRAAAGAGGPLIFAGTWGRAMTTDDPKESSSRRPETDGLRRAAPVPPSSGGGPVAGGAARGSSTG